jgi:pyruvate,water dikinase
MPDSRLPTPDLILSETIQMSTSAELILWMEDPRSTVTEVVGAKASALARVAASSSPQGDSLHIPTPAGFIISVQACFELLGQDSVRDPLSSLLQSLADGQILPMSFAEQAQSLIDHAAISEQLLNQLGPAFAQLQGTDADAVFAVRSSAIYEDLEQASYAGQYETVLAVHDLAEVLDAYRTILGSMFSAQVLAYSNARQQPFGANLMAVVVQRMVRSDLGASGVLLSADRDLQVHATSSHGHNNNNNNKTEDLDTSVTSIEACWGIGDALVDGLIIPERYEVLHQSRSGIAVPEVRVFAQRQLLKSNGSADLVPTSVTEQSTQVLRVDQILLLNDWGQLLAERFGHQVELEWALDGITQEMVLLQVRPFLQTAEPKHAYPSLADPEAAIALTSGLAIGSGTVESSVCVLSDPHEPGAFKEGDVLVTHSTNPSWLPLMLQASALITDQGGRNSHAAILGRELGLLCVVGCIDATTKLLHEDHVRVICDQGVGKVMPADTAARNSG